MKKKVTKYIGWENALTEFFKCNFKPGEIIKREWFEENFQLEKVTSPLDIKGYNKRKIEFMSNMKHFRDALLERHQWLLRTRPGVGYEIVPPTEQTSYSMEKGADAVKAAFSKTARQLVNVRMEELTEEQRRENADAIARIGTLRAVIRFKPDKPSDLDRLLK